MPIINTPAPLVFGVSNNENKTPKLGPKIVPVTAQLANNASVVIDLSALQQTGRIDTIQSVMIDNSQSAQPVTLSTQIIGQNLVVPAYSQAVLPVFSVSPCIFTASSAGNVNVPMYFLNVALDAMVWATQVFTFTNGKLIVSDPALEALISNGGLNVNVLTTPENTGATRAFSIGLATTTPAVGAAAGAGLHWYISGIQTYFRGDATLASAANVTLTIGFTNGGDTVYAGGQYIGTVAQMQPVGLVIQNFTHPIKSLQTNDTIQASLSSALVTGTCSVQVFGYAAT